MSDHLSQESFTILSEDLESFRRLDQYLGKKFPDLSRTFIKGLFEKGMVEVSKSSSYQGKLELKRMPPVETEIVITIPEPAPSEAMPEDIPINILFEDEHLIIINKEAGMVVHPAPGNYTGTLVNAVLFHCPDLKGIGDQKRPGIVHRLDKGTSGVMVVAKNQLAHQGLVDLFSTHDIKREYQAISMSTKIPPEKTLKSKIGRDPNNRIRMAVNTKGGKESITHLKVIEFFDSCTHVQLTLETGRTHQIRVHLASLLTAPLCMDPTYGQPKSHLRKLPNLISAHLKNYPHPLLHAKTLGFIHPITKEELLFKAPPPPIFQKTLELLREQK